VRIVIRLLSCVVIAGSAITVWTRAGLVFVLGPQLTAVCLWIAAGGSVCAVTALALTRKPNRPQPYRPPDPRPAGAVHSDRGTVAVMNGLQTRHAHQSAVKRWVSPPITVRNTVPPPSGPYRRLGVRGALAWLPCAAQIIRSRCARPPAA